MNLEFKLPPERYFIMENIAQNAIPKYHNINDLISILLNESTI